MTLNMLTDPLYTGRRADTESDLVDYPYATFQDKTSTTGNNGTPLTYAKQYKDFDGFRQAILALGKITPNGVPDTVNDSDILTALMAQYGGLFEIYAAGATNSTRYDLPLSLIDNSSIRNYKGEGTSYHLRSGLVGGGIKFDSTGSAQVGDSDPHIRVSTFVISDWGVGWTVDGLVHYQTAGYKTLTGIPLDAAIYSVQMEVTMSDGDKYTTYCNCKINRSAVFDWLTLEGAAIVLPLGSGVIDNTADITLTVAYDPSDVD